jgi:excisionase family DNA binding protein
MCPPIAARRNNMVVQMMPVQDDVLLTFKEAMNYLRVSRSTLYRLMWSGQLTGHKVGSTWRFYREDLRACVGREVPVMSSPVLVD